MNLPARPTYQELEVYILGIDSAQLYKNSILNRKGKTTGDIFVSEAISKIILENTLLEKTPEITRQKSYFSNHSKDIAIPTSNRQEEIDAIRFYKTYNWIVDYQVPLKNKQTDKIGKLDLLLLKHNHLILCELKVEKSEESLLRTILEIETYYRTINKDKLITDYAVENYYASDISKAIMIYKDSRQYRELQSLDMPHTIKMLTKLDITVFIVDDFI